MSLVERMTSPELRAALKRSALMLTPANPAHVRLWAGEAARAPALGGPDQRDLNRFPEPRSIALLTRMAELHGAPVECVAPIGDVAEGAAALVRTFRAPGGNGPVILGSSGFEAARLAALVQGAAPVDAAPGALAAFDPRRIESALADVKGDAVVLLASPTHETGELVAAKTLTELAERWPKALFVLDESFVEYATTVSLARVAAASENLVVLRSLSRAYGVAGIGCGTLIGPRDVVELVRGAVADRPLPRPTVALALAALDPLRAPLLAESIAETVAERERVAAALKGSPSVERVAPGVANFLAVGVRDGAAIKRRLGELSIVVDWTDEALSSLRLTIGALEENDLALTAFGVAGAEAKVRRRRRAQTSRDTRETRISVSVDLDAPADANVRTGVGYFDHMLEQVSKHGGFKLTLFCAGDTDVDAHHTIEDCMLALGAALKQALGDKRGIARYGFTLPMDEAEAEALIDLSGRPYTVFEGQFTATHIGDFPTEMTAHAFRSLAESMGAAIHVKVRGENDHHKTEACFKAFGRAFRQAIRFEGEDLPSTKGVL
jgi:histidinol-phosphate aminotransferase/imidazoleglycerol-phosphate dehydratase/histidinol-phosphatase